jgi:hypothetical protein
VNACWVEQFTYRVYCDVMYQLYQFPRNQHGIVEKKQIYLYLIGKLFRLCGPIHTDGKYVILLRNSLFLYDSCIPKNIHRKFLLLHFYSLLVLFVNYVIKYNNFIFNHLQIFNCLINGVLSFSCL